MVKINFFTDMLEKHMIKRHFLFKEDHIGTKEFVQRKLNELNIQNAYVTDVTDKITFRGHPEFCIFGTIYFPEDRFNDILNAKYEDGSQCKNPLTNKTYNCKKSLFVKAFDSFDEAKTYCSNMLFNQTNNSRS